LIPFNPSIVLEKMKELKPAPRTPSPELEKLDSNSFFLCTPKKHQLPAYRAHIKKKLQLSLLSESLLSPTLATSTYKLLKG
jgi:hypothetical protein